MARTGLVYHPIYLEHETHFHPENRQRLSRTVEHLKSVGLWERLHHIEARRATVEEVALVHKKSYIEEVEKFCAAGGGHLDMDTVVGPRSYEAALFAVGGLLAASDAVINGEVANACCLVRPPGHHAMPDRAMGFCVFNNVAIAAKYLQKTHNIQKVAIIDWDVHHGNGTQHVFWRDGSVFYLSMHRWPFYPGTGSDRERGEGVGEGTTLNLPFSAFDHRERVLENFKSALEEVEKFAPDFVLISAGYDAYELDPIGGLGLKIEDYRQLTDWVCKLAKRTAGGRVISTLEGGYNLEALPQMIEGHIRGLLAASEGAD